MRFSKIIFYLIVIIFILGTIVEICLLLMPFHTAKLLACKISLTGNPKRFTEEFFHTIKIQGIFLVFFFIFIEYLLFKYKNIICSWLSYNLPSKHSISSIFEFKKIFPFQVKIMLLIILIGIGLRVVRMQGIMEEDEAKDYLQYAQNPITAVSMYLGDANNHIFHTLLVSIVTKIIGDSPWAIRSIAFLSGLVSIILIFFVYASSVKNEFFTEGIIAVSLMAFYPMLCEYSANARGYTLQIMLALLSWLLFVRIYEGKRDLILVLSFFISLCMWTIATSLYIFIGLLFSFIIIAIEKKITLKDIFIFLISTCLISLVLWSPAIVVSGVKPILFGADANPGAAGLPVNPFFLRFKNLKDIFSLSIGMFGVILSISSAIFSLIFINKPWKWIFIGLCCSAVLINAILRVTPPSRVWLFYFPLIAIFIDFFINTLLSRIRIKKSIIYAIVLALIISYVIPVIPSILNYGPDDRQVAKFAKHVAREYKNGIVIAIALTTSHYEGKALGCNRYTVRYYLKRAGIPSSAFKWRAHPESDIFWFIGVQPDGSPIKTFQKIKWDFWIGPYGLKKNVSKEFICNLPAEAL